MDLATPNAVQSTQAMFTQVGPTRQIHFGNVLCMSISKVTPDFREIVSSTRTSHSSNCCGMLSCAHAHSRKCCGAHSRWRPTAVGAVVRMLGDVPQLGQLCVHWRSNRFSWNCARSWFDIKISPSTLYGVGLMGVAKLVNSVVSFTVLSGGEVL